MAGQHIKYAAVGFRPKASPSTINRFIRELPEEKRQSLFQVAEELKSSDLIELSEDRTPIHVHNVSLRK